MTNLPRFNDVSDVIASTAPDVPTYCLHLPQLERNAAEFVGRFPGEVAYAVKCNSHPLILEALVSGGIQSFDVASVPEMAAARQALPNAHLHFMHPVKRPQEIRTSYEQYGVRSFAVDHPDEIDKIVTAIGGPQPDTQLFVRLSTEAGSQTVTYDLSAKFGAKPDRAGQMLRQIQQMGMKPALCFHVGSQVLDAAAYEQTMALAAHTIKDAGVPLTALDIGGGFPAGYLGETEHHWTEVLERAVAAVKSIALPDSVPLMCEPGRALVADGASLLTSVLLRDDDLLFINDGAWGAFSESLTADTQWPARAHRASGQMMETQLKEFRIAGVTCDSCDMLKGTYRLPADTTGGDWINFSMMGAYSQVLRTDFNGFGEHELVLVDSSDDNP